MLVRRLGQILIAGVVVLSMGVMGGYVLEASEHNPPSFAVSQ